MKKILLLSILFISSNELLGSRCTLVNGTSYSYPAGVTMAFGVSFSPDSSLMATANFVSNNLSLFNITDGVLTGGINYPAPACAQLAFSPKGNILAAIDSAADGVRVFSVAGSELSNSTFYALPAGASDPQSLAFSPDGSKLVVGESLSGDNAISAFEVVGDVLTNGVRVSLPFGGSSVRGLSFAPPALLATANGISGDVTVFWPGGKGGFSNGITYATPTGVTDLQGIAFSRDGKYLICVGSSAFALFEVVYDLFLDTGVAVPAIAGTNRAVPGSYLSPDGKLFAVPYLLSDNVSLYDFEDGVLSNGTNFALPAGGDRPEYGTFSPDGQLYVTVNQVSQDISVFKVSCPVPDSTTTTTTTTTTGAMSTTGGGTTSFGTTTSQSTAVPGSDNSAGSCIESSILSFVVMP